MTGKGCYKKAEEHGYKLVQHQGFVEVVRPNGTSFGCITVKHAVDEIEKEVNKK